MRPFDTVNFSEVSISFILERNSVGDASSFCTSVHHPHSQLHFFTQEYKDIFEPLLLEECCAQILRGMEEGEVLSPHRAVVGAAEMVRNQAAVGPFATPEV